MAYRPLHIAGGVLVTALSLTATMTVVTGLRAPQIAADRAGDARSHVESKTGDGSAIADVTPAESPYFPPAVEDHPFPGVSVVAALDDGPNGYGNRVVPVSIGGRSHHVHEPRPEHRGYEELPAPPESVAQVAMVETSDPVPPAPIQELVSELSKLRTDIQEFGANAHGHSAVQAEMQSLRAQLAAMHEQRRIEDLQNDVLNLAQRQEDLESHVEAQAAPVPDPVPVVIQPVEPVAITIEPVSGESGHWTAQLIAADPAAVLRRLSEVGQWNLVLNRGVEGPISLSINSATAEELLQAVAASLDCAVIDEGSSRLIVPAAQAAERQSPSEATVAKLLRPSFIAAADLLPLVRPMLTPGLGEVAITPDGPEAAAVPTRAQSDALLIVDYPAVVQQIETMLAEVDVAPEEFVIEAVITAVHWNERTQFGVVPALEQQGVCSAPIARDRGNLRGRPARAAQFRGDARDLLNALQKVADIHVEATPSLHVLNRQQAEIEVGANIAYREQIAFGRRLRLVEEEIDFLPSRTELTVRPVLQGDHTVRLQVHPRVTHVHSDPVSGLPREAVAELNTEVTIPLGCTAVIGGLTRSTDGSHPAGSPMSRWLGRRGRPQPGMGADHETIELVVMLTPRRACDVDSVAVVPPAYFPSDQASTSADSPTSATVDTEFAPAPLPVDVSPAPIPTAPQPVASPPLLKRLLGRRMDAPRAASDAAPQAALAGSQPPPFPTVPPPVVEPVQITLDDDVGDAETLTVAEPTRFVMQLTPTADVPQAPPETAPAEIQTVSIEREVLPVPPEPAAPLAVVSVDPAYVPPPPPETAPQPIFRQDPAAYIPPAPTGRARRRNERDARQDVRPDGRDERGRNIRRTSDDTGSPLAPRR